MESGTSGVELTSNDPLSGVVVTPASTTAGATNIDCAITLTTTVNIPIGGHIQVTFPMGFYVSSNTLSSPVGINAASTVSSSGRVVTITITGAAAAPGSISFTINGITNPGNQDDLFVIQSDCGIGAGTSSAYIVATTAISGTVIETGTGAGTIFNVGALATPTLALQSSIAGDTDSVDVSFPATTCLPVGGRMVVEFPSTFRVAATTLSSLVNINAASTITSSATTATLTVAVASVCGSTASFRMNGITNAGTRIYSSCHTRHDIE
jgi:hypothetical protein